MHSWLPSGRPCDPRSSATTSYPRHPPAKRGQCTRLDSGGSALRLVVRRTRLRCCHASAAARLAVMTATVAPEFNRGKVCRPESAWAVRLDRHTDRDWSTYQGWWTMYSGPGTDTIAREYSAIRCFRRAGDGGRQLLHKNLISVNLGFGSPVQRSDGFWESNMSYSVDDAPYSCSLRLAETEAALPAHRLRRLTVISANAYVLCPAALPQHAPACADEALPAPPDVWNYEAFFHDGENRWSLGAVYDVASGALRHHFFIREYDIPADPESSIDPDSLPIPAARPSAQQSDVAAGAGGASGQSTRASYGTDGALRMDTAESGSVTLPEAPGNIFLGYPDGMFAHIPERLPPARSGDVTFTWGGKMRLNDWRQQMTATFAADGGALASVSATSWQQQGGAA